MSFVRTFEDFAPPARVDDVPFAEVVISEAASEDGTFVDIDTQALSPVDDNPANPQNRSFTTVLATLDPAAWFRFEWVDGDGNSYLSEPFFFSTVTAVYTSAASLREELGVDSTVLADVDAGKLIGQAEDLIDDLLGARSIDNETGRKVDVDAVEEWQAEKLQRATNLAARFLFENPGWLTEQRHASKGSDIPLSTPYGTTMPGVTILLDATGLRRLAARASRSSGGGHRDSVIGNLPEPD